MTIHLETFGTHKRKKGRASLYSCVVMLPPSATASLSKTEIAFLQARKPPSTVDKSSSITL